VIYEFFNPADYTLRDATQATSRGTRTGALIVDNMTGKTQQVTVTNPDTARSARSTSPRTGRADGGAAGRARPTRRPITTMEDLAGLQPSLT
jgi:hypothetical protein